MGKLLARLGAATKGSRGAVLTALVTSALVALFSLTPAHDRLEYVLYDLRFKMKPKAEPLPELVLLNVDDASVSALGVYPWPRHYYAFALRQLAAAGLGSLVFDFQFMDASPAFLNLAGFDALYSHLSAGGALAPDDLYAAVIDNDKDLALAVRDFGRAVIPFSFAKVESKLTLSPEAAAAREAAIRLFEEKASLPIPRGLEARFRALADPDRVTINYPIPELMEAAGSFGFVDNDADLDGSHRRVRLVRVFGDRVYLHLSLVAFLRMCGSGISDVEVVPGERIVVRGGVHPATGRRGDITIPVDRECGIFFDWMGDFEHTARYVPAHALIEYPAHAEQFEMQLMLKDMASGRDDRTELAEALEAQKAAILAETDFERRFALKREYEGTLGRYKAVIQDYLDETQAELDALLAAKAAGDDVPEDGISSLRDLLTAISTKTEVDYLFDSVAVFGLTATGTQDEGVTPLSNNYWMVGSYPTAINTIARGRFIREAPDYAEFAAMAALAVALALFIHDRSAKLSYAAIGIAVAAVNAAIVLAFSEAYVWIDQVSLNLALIAPSAVIMIAKFAGEEEHRQFIQGAFSKYLSQEVIDRIIENPDALKLGGESCDITTFFSDVAGFSSISERLSAEGLVHLLNEYLSEMTDIIMGEEGTVDKYEGDAIMAFWGAPLAFPDHAYRACLSAVLMQRRLGEMRGRWREEGRDELRVRMGVNSGPAVAGNMGSRTRMNYTVMGDSVNLASRLEGANKAYGTYTMVSQNTHASVKDQFRFRELDTIRVVGKNEPITVYELLEISGKVPEKKEETISHYERGLASYKGRRWKEAMVGFARALRLDIDDGPSRLYYRRCRAFMKVPPAADWDGVNTLTSK
ncbi:MAG: adenylate/guanylate cyclase domain-containing protein [Spirochaetes bacterium]|nr:adenylate/guanylate cyclase domain-containing protein [Spirochaetota bacterium]MBU1082374.1 adenylate/guanylate cyclase domain-containing protein [Spirochaetota bacterium]